MHLTWYGSNSWLIEIANQRILLDPWLVGPLVFGKQSWFFKAEQPQTYPIPESVDLILLSQGLPDHAHPATLAELDKNIPVWGSPNAIKVASQFGFQSLTALPHGKSAQMGDLHVQAFPGSPIGPFLTENAFVLKNLQTSESLYYEPHGFHSPELQGVGPIDAALVPLIDLMIPLVGAFIQGSEAAIALAEQIQAQKLIPTTVGGEVTYTGLLNAILSSQGDLASLRQTLQQKGLKTQVLDPLPPGERVEVTVQSSEIQVSEVNPV